MSESYVECMVARKTKPIESFVKYVLYGLTGFAILGALFTSILVFFIAAIALGVGSYFFSLYTDIEYEYLYLDKEIVVDKVLKKSKRKRVATYELEKIEIFAPIKSYHLDNFKNRQAKVVDISSGVENMPDKRYVFFYNGEQKIIIEPNEELVKIMKNVAPRKVFSD